MVGARLGDSDTMIPWPLLASKLKQNGSANLTMGEIDGVQVGPFTNLAVFPFPEESAATVPCPSSSFQCPTSPAAGLTPATSPAATSTGASRGEAASRSIGE